MVPGFHFARGVARASSRELPSMVKEEPRKRRRGKFMRVGPGTHERAEIPPLRDGKMRRSSGRTDKHGEFGNRAGSPGKGGHDVSSYGKFLRGDAPGRCN